MEPTLETKPLDAWSRGERVRTVKQIFNTITGHYDLLNRIMSARRDVAWRRFAVSRVPETAARVLDVATGTGDLALEVAGSMAHVRVVGVDFVERMMRVAREKTVRARLTERTVHGEST